MIFIGKQVLLGYNAGLEHYFAIWTFCKKFRFAVTDCHKMHPHGECQCRDPTFSISSFNNCKQISYKESCLKKVPSSSPLHHHSQSSFMSDYARLKSDYGNLLYTGQEFNRIKRLLGGFYALSAGIGVISPKVMSIALASSSTIAVCFMTMHIVIFVFLNPWGLYQFGKRYVHELYHDASTDTYTVTLLSPTIKGSKILQFKPRDCQMPANPTLFTSFFVNGKSLFINSDSMNYHDYMTMLRYASEYDYENPDRQEQFDNSKKEDSKKT